MKYNVTLDLTHGEVETVLIGLALLSYRLEKVDDTIRVQNVNLLVEHIIRTTTREARRKHDRGGVQ